MRRATKRCKMCIRDRYDFTYNNNYQSCDAYRFHKLVTASKNLDGAIIYNDNRFNALRSSLGYLMYDYKSELDNKSIVFCEEQLSENGGRTGKTLTCKMLEQMGCILAKINGRKVDFSNRFQMCIRDSTVLLFFAKLFLLYYYSLNIQLYFL